MQMAGYSAPTMDLRAVPGLQEAVDWTMATTVTTARRVIALASLIDRSPSSAVDYEIVHIDSRSDGLAQIGAALAGSPH
mgnify:CR=1 FL=1